MPRKKRSILTPDDKALLIELKESNPTSNYSAIGELFYNKTKIVLSNSCISNIWKHREEIKTGHSSALDESCDLISISGIIIERMKERITKKESVDEKWVIHEAKRIVSDYKLDSSRYVFPSQWAQGILNGKCNDQLIIKNGSSLGKSQGSIANTSKSTNKISATKSVKQLLTVTPIEKQQLLEHLNETDSTIDLHDRNVNPVIPTLISKSIKERKTEHKRDKEKNGEDSLSPPNKRKSLIESFKDLCKEKDYRSVAFSIIEAAYKENPYYVPIMNKELEDIKKTLQFMVEKDGKKW